MINFTVRATFGFFMRFVVIADFCTTCASNRSMTGSVSIAETLAFKTSEKV